MSVTVLYLVYTCPPTIIQTAEAAEHTADHIPRMRTTFSWHRLPTYPYQSTTYHRNFLGLGIEKEEDTMMNPTYRNQVAEYTPLDTMNPVCLKGRGA